MMEEAHFRARLAEFGTKGSVERVSEGDYRNEDGVVWVRISGLERDMKRMEEAIIEGIKRDEEEMRYYAAKTGLVEISEGGEKMAWSCGQKIVSVAPSADVVMDIEVCGDMASYLCIDYTKCEAYPICVRHKVVLELCEDGTRRELGFRYLAFMGVRDDALYEAVSAAEEWEIKQGVRRELCWEKEAYFEELVKREKN